MQGRKNHSGTPFTCLSVISNILRRPQKGLWDNDAAEHCLFAAIGVFNRGWVYVLAVVITARIPANNGNCVIFAQAVVVKVVIAFIICAIRERCLHLVWVLAIKEVIDSLSQDYE